MAELLMQDVDLRDRYHIMSRLVAPRPIALVSSLSEDGIANLAPFSFFNIGGANPPSAMICPVSDRAGSVKDTLNNIRQTGEYVINIVVRDMADKMILCSSPVPPEVDEFELSGFTKAPAETVNAPRVQESPASLEMKLFKVIDHGGGPLASHYIIGEIQHMFIHDSILVDGKPDNRKIEHLGRLGEDYYCSMSQENLFELQRPGS